MKKAWCCSHQGKGCADGEATARGRLDSGGGGRGGEENRHGGPGRGHFGGGEDDDRLSASHSMLYRQKFGLPADGPPEPEPLEVGALRSPGILGVALAAFVVAAVAGLTILKSLVRGGGYRLVASAPGARPNFARSLMVSPADDEYDELELAVAAGVGESGDGDLFE